MKRRDLLLIACALLIAGALFGLSRLRAKEPVSTVVVTIDGKEALRVPLSEDGVYTFEQDDGSRNVLEVSGGAARMIEANCRDRLCVQQGATSSAAKTIVCLPHKLVVTLETDGAQTPTDDLDVVIY